MIDRDLAARQRVLEALRGGATVSGAAKAAGLSRQSVYQWRARGGDPELAAALEAARLRGGRGRRKGPRLDAPPLPVAAPGPAAAGAPEPGARRERALAVLDQLMSDPTVAARDRISAARALVALPGVPAPAVEPAKGGGQGPPLRLLDRAQAVEKARAFLGGEAACP